MRRGDKTSKRESSVVSGNERRWLAGFLFLVCLQERGYYGSKAVRWLLLLFRGVLDIDLSPTQRR